ncbi:MAG TPA: pyridoxamine 5'-phosphate oxidase family protein [Candidatus Limnocylindrales bacterium]|nr:pyridoxamine 5'-phosphate oxidase family protein [Candidatus Limnocylindrales bacterium]
MAGPPILTDAERAFAATARSATLATRSPSGRPRLVPICFVVSPDGPDGKPRLHSPLDEKPKASDDPHDLARVRDLLVLPEATLLVDRWSEDWSRLAWLRLECHTELLEPEPREVEEHAAAVAALHAKYPQYADHDLASRPVLRFAVLRAISWGDLGPDPAPDSASGTDPAHAAGGSGSSSSPGGSHPR